MKKLGLALVFAALAQAGLAKGVGGTFPSIDGGTVSIEDWRGQYDGLQKVYDTYRDRGLVVLAVPSDDFNQELGSAEEVKEFCELNYGIDMPMTDITHVKGSKAHPFYQSVMRETGFVPSWNFNKVLVSPEGDVVATWGSAVRPESRRVTEKIAALLD